MLFRLLGICTPIMFLAFQANADALIGYNLTALGGAEYQYDYSVFNDGSLGPNVPIQLFDILFNPALYQAGSLSVVTSPLLNSEWSQEVLASVGVAPADYDVFALNGGIPVGNTVSGFAVRFEWIGQGLPGAQPFQISDPNSFNVLQTGETGETGETTPGPTPEPSTFWMLAMTLAIFLAGFRSIKALALRAGFNVRPH
ncbi:MAG: PEP-CTERM sorting domain-containing protein [Bryobacteraceae bacterium]|jgi:hypothetical protein